VEPELIDQAGGEVLLDDAGSSSEQDVLATGGLLRLFEGGSDPVGDEEEGRASIHLLGLTRVMREDEGGDVVGRIVAPPTLPRWIL
jgi:hypothetical protein